jgi:O-antigen ligase
VLSDAQDGRPAGIAFVAFATGYAILMRAFGTNTWGRLEGFGMYDSNDIASVFAVSFPLAAGLLLRARGRARWVAGAGVVLLVLTVVASGSRGGTLALLAGAIVFTLGVRGSRRFWIIILFVAGGFATWATASQQFRNRMKSLTTLEDDYNYTDATGRKAVWERGRGYILEHPLIGVGIGNFPIKEGENLAAQGLHGKWSTAHNAYIQSYAELGIPGGTIFVLILLMSGSVGYGFARGRRVSPTVELHRPEYAASIAAFAVVGLIALADRAVEREKRMGGAVSWNDQTVIGRPKGRGGLANGTFRMVAPPVRGHGG